MLGLRFTLYGLRACACAFSHATTPCLSRESRHSSPCGDFKPSLGGGSVPTEGPSWGYPRCVLGAIGAFLSTFGLEEPRFPEICLKIDVRIPPRRALRGLAAHPRKVDIRLPGKGDSNFHGARPVHQKHRWIRTSRLSIENSLSSSALWPWTPAQNHQPPLVN